MKYGIMEGFRMYNTKVSYGLTPDDDRVSLFSKAGELGFQGIEFGIDLDYREDPLWTGDGNTRQAMREVSQTTGVKAASVCLHLLNYKEHSPASDEAEHRETAGEIIRNTIEACVYIGAEVILLPFFGTAALRSEEQIQHLVGEMKTLSPIAEDKGVCLALETSLNADDMVRIVEAIESDYVQVYFDTGNAAGIGYNIVQEIEGLGKYIVQTHIKDTPSIRMLGEGNIDFEAAIGALKKVGFKGYLMLETPSTEDSVAAAVKNLAYIKGVVER
ncbi:sugar phosphate isomerase/epimerase [Candidatus Poribacteria bacterium]|nr:sugar phosphate isomerase/epimerase [Candidatus Poribacteria bacterium]